MIARQKISNYSLALLAAGVLSCQAPADKESPPPQPSPTPASSRNDDDGATIPVSGQLSGAVLLPLQNTDAIVASLGIKTLQERGFSGRGIRVAVLDNGFSTLDDSRGKRLPKDTSLDLGTGNKPQDTTHGTRMAEIIRAVATGNNGATSEAVGPKILLFNANGYTNFVHAIDAAIAAKVDIILYSQVWEYGGNGDGKGFIDAQVSRATSAGILWVNAAGNNGKSTWRGKLDIRPDRSASLPYGGRYVRMKVTSATSPVKIVLSWNDFTNSPQYRTHQDLDLELSDCRGRAIAKSELRQDGVKPSPSASPVAGTPEHSDHAREMIRTTLPMGTYCLAVEATSDNFRDDTAIRLTADGMGVEFIDRNYDGQLLMPADHPAALVVGASDVDYSATEGARQFPGLAGSPDFSVVSRVDFGGDQVFFGTSAAAAIAVGALSTMAEARGHVPIKSELAGEFRRGESLSRSGGGQWRAVTWCSGQSIESDLLCGEKAGSDTGFRWEAPTLNLVGARW